MCSFIDKYVSVIELSWVCRNSDCAISSERQVTPGTLTGRGGDLLGLGSEPVVSQGHGVKVELRGQCRWWPMDNCL
jgi:hypothetical protein